MKNFYSLGTKKYYIKRKSNSSMDYARGYWGEIIDPDGNQRNRLQEREKHLEDIQQELSYINSLKPGKILDVGCGLGYLLSGVNNNWEKYGVEISEYAANHAKKWTDNIYIGELQDINFVKDYFDLVVIHHVIEHIKKPEIVINEIHRILKNNGFLILGTPDFDSGCARLFGDNFRLLHDKTHLSLFSNESMHRFLRDFNFQIINVEYPFFDTRYFI